MLESLHVKNFAIIEDLTVGFKDGMTVLTGQTGAGKSLIIDSISLLLGKRSDTDMIRYGASKAEIEGTFTYKNVEIDDFLNSNGIPVQERLVISREIQKSRSVAKVNGVVISVQMLKALSTMLADIHVQHDTYSLFNPDTYIALIDKAADKEFYEIYNKYSTEYLAYMKQYDKYKYIISKAKESKDRIDYLEFSYKEISSLNLSKDEDITLEENVNKLKNFDKIYTSLQESIRNLENEYFSLDNIYLAYKELDRIKEYDPLYASSSASIEEAYYNLSDTLSSLKSSLGGLDYDENELNSLNERLSEINNLKIKYHKSLNELIDYQESLALEIKMINNYDEVLKEEEEKLKKCYEKLSNVALKLSKNRQNRARLIEKDIISLCKDLELPHTRFEIQFTLPAMDNFKDNSIFSDDGIDKVEFLLSTNLGEPVLPLSKVASGGELSRIMLAFKTYFAKQAGLSLLIFDEIDSGVSGHVAYEIARKMKEISKSSQVLAITHLPQVACAADWQYFVYKEEHDGRTLTNFKILDDSDRQTEIAHMISGEKVSKYALEAASEMLSTFK